MILYYFPIAHPLKAQGSKIALTSASGCRASGNFDISSENCFPTYAINFSDAGQVPILRYFETRSDS